MVALFIFLVAAAVAGMFSRSFTWLSYLMLASASFVLAVGYYFSPSLW